MNNPPGQLQMPLHVDAKQSSAGPAPSANGAGTQAGDSGFAQALRLLQMLAPDSVQAPAGQGGKDHKASSADTTQKQAGDGKDLPLSALLLPLLQQIQTPSQAKSASANTPAGSVVSSGDLSPASLANLRDVLQLLGGKGTATSGEGELKAWLAALAQTGASTTGAHVAESAASSNASMIAALAAHAGTGTAATGNAQQQQQQAAVTQTPLTLADPGFANALGDRVSWLAGNAGNNVAQLQLHPRELGPMLVHVKVDGHHTEVLFQTQHAVVRDALEAAMPRLREMLAQGGQQQVSVNVQQQAGGWSGQSGQGQQQTPQWASPQAWSGFTQVGGESSDLPSPLARWYGMQNGMIDTYV